MFVLVENDSITKTLNSSRGITIGENQYPRAIYTLWSTAEREAIGIYEVVFDNSNKRDAVYYNNTGYSFDFSDGVATASYGSPTAKELDDRNATDKDDVELDPVVIIQGLKSQKKKFIKQQASGLLTPLDWYVIKATEVESYSVPSAITTYRANVRTKSNTMETAIDNASDVDALATLYNYTEQPDGTQTRPLGEFPTLDI